MADFSFTITHKDPRSRARAGVLHTKHGELKTPYLITVATNARVNALQTQDLYDVGMQASLINTYHLHFRPVEQFVRWFDLDKKYSKYKKPLDVLIKELGGAHKIMKFDKPLFSDSGGFQAFSLGYGNEHGIGKVGKILSPAEKKQLAATIRENMVKITEKGVTFKLLEPYGGGKEFMSPKMSMEIQSNLGADIIMAFDECTSPSSPYAYIKKAMERTHRWAKESLKYHDKEQALYGIIQGGEHKDLRIASSKFINSLPFDGIAIGGSFWALGENTEKAGTENVLDWVIPLLDERPRHFLGIGYVVDLFEGVARGIDTFDCVDHTKTARHGHLLISPKNGGTPKNHFKLSLKQAQHRDDPLPIDPGCKCSTCKSHTRGELRKIVMDPKEEVRRVYHRLATIHNVFFMENLMKNMRKSIEQDRFLEFKEEWMGEK